MQSDLCEAIRSFHRQRVYAMEQRKRADLALGSFLRMALGWSLALPKAEQEAIRAKASGLMDIGDQIAKQEAKPEEKRQPIYGSDDPAFIEWRHVIMASIKARAPFDQIEKMATKEMEALAAQLPVWAAFAEAVPGIGQKSLAIIVGEAGALWPVVRDDEGRIISGYPKKGHLWKRMGLALVDGVRQGGLPKNAPKADWIEHGYNRARRSRIWTIGDSLIKAQGPYREVYLTRLAQEHAKALDEGLTPASTDAATVESWTKRDLPPIAKITKSQFDPTLHRTAGHMANRAQRYMEKRLLRDLWQEWRRPLLGLPDKATVEVAAADILAEIEADPESHATEDSPRFNSAADLIGYLKAAE